ncbi:MULTISPECIES: hypothetical protein [unclassified Ensifer]|uniref:DUF6950 family protein n=1 Tax=unclassified Ensifer TaxID=2633371 RepID=UPI00070BB01F|nr:MULTISPECIES: hypothetical protein [unclassified Ensifer]KQW62857.1 hypothetical protein ASD02_01675 [Ensifer sp. Root1252]KRC83678.1 hypothetical protein ASE32_01665 [Ensifer sp. Root231]KRD04031.1 hypothetical protein ASE47_00325 [Ensifer sp. Root258]
MPDIAEELRRFLEEAQNEPCVWGASDCSRWAASWVARVRGKDVPLPCWATKEEAHDLIAQAGSLEQLWSEALFVFGLRECGAPQLGDVGIIETARFGQVGGIFIAGGYFAWRAEMGVIYLTPRQIVKAWAIL